MVEAIAIGLAGLAMGAGAVGASRWLGRGARVHTAAVMADLVWQRDGRAALASALALPGDSATIANRAIAALVTWTKASMGACTSLVGGEPQPVARDARVGAAPLNVVVVPMHAAGVVVGKLEFGFASEIDHATRTLLEAGAAMIGVALDAADNRAQLVVARAEAARLGAHHKQRQTEADATKVVESHHAIGLARASRHKSEFLATMSHELRTPLNSSLILARLLADNPAGNLTAEQVTFAETIFTAGNDLILLINDILDFSKVEAGHIELHVEPLDLTHVQVALTRTFAPIAAARGIRLAVVVEQSAPTAFVSDDRRVQQILRNLLANACKFTERGGVTMAVRGAPEYVAFVVSDTGIGIPAASLELIFEPFQQAQGALRTHPGGTGLGLSISRQLASLLGGTLTVTSTLGVGSTFELRLPRVLLAPRARVEPDVVDVAPPPALMRDAVPGHRVALIVEADVRSVFTLTQALEAHGVRAIVARTSDEARARLRSDAQIDLVLIDLVTPGLGGGALAASIRDAPRRARTPVVALAAGPLVPLPPGVDASLHGPYDPATFAGLLHTWLA